MTGGKVVISTALDNSGFAKDAGGLRRAMDKMGRSLGRVFADSMDKGSRQVDVLTQRLGRQQEAARKAAREVEEIRRQYEALAGSDATPASLKRLEAELSRVQKEVQRTEKEYASLEAQLRKVQDVADFERLASGAVSPGNEVEMERLVGELDAAGEKLGGLDDKAEKLRSTIESIRLNPEQSEEARKLAAKLQNAEEKAGRLANEAEHTADQVAKLSQKSEDLPKPPDKAAKAMGRFSREAKGANREARRTTKGLGLAGAAVHSLGKRIARLAAALVFNQIRRALRSLTDYLNKAMRTNQQFVSSLAGIKGNLLTAFQPIFDVVMPAINALMAGLAKVTAYIAAFVNLLFGKSIQGSKDAAKNLYSQAKGYDAVGKSADKAAGKLTAFDELNVLGRDDEGGGGGSDGIPPDFEQDFSFFDQVSEKVKDFLDVFKKAWDNVGDFGNSIGDPEDYDKLYEVLSSPDEYHTISMPYGRNGTLTYEAYVSGVKDSVYRIHNGITYWNKLTASFIARSPSRT